MVLPPAAILQRATQPGEVAAFVVADFLAEQVGPRHQPPCPGIQRIGQFVGPLLLRGGGIGFEQLYRRGIDVVAGSERIVAPAGNVGQLARAKIDLGPQAGKAALAVVEAALVDRYLEGIAREQAVAVGRRTIAFALSPFALCDQPQAAAPVGEAAAHHHGIRAADAPAIETVAEVAGIIACQCRQPEGETATQRAGDHAARRHRGPAAPAIDRAFQRKARRSAESLLRIGRCHHHRPAGGVAAKGHPLRPAQQVHPLHVDHVEHGAGVDAHVYAIDEQPHAGIDRGDGAVDAKAAHGEIGHPAECSDGIKRDIGRGLAEAGQVAEGAGIQFRGIDAAGAAGIVKQGLAAILDGDDDDRSGSLFRAFRRCILRLGGSGCAQGYAKRNGGCGRPAGGAKCHGFPL